MVDMSTSLDSNNRSQHQPLDVEMSTQSTSYKMPAIFVGHGSPMIALEQNRNTEAWHEFATEIPTPRAILVISAHWYVRGTSVTTMRQPKTIHDFGGFPDELFAVQYPAPGMPELAAEIAEVAKPTRIVEDATSWGLDHGTWTVLTHMYPKANVPVVQLSIDNTMHAEDHLKLGAALTPLRGNGVLIVASGNVVHNLRAARWGMTTGFEWAQQFDDDVRDVMTRTPGDSVSLTSHRYYERAAPTPEHFLPLHYIAGLAAEDNVPTEALVGGCTMGSISMASFVLR
jgi:4,5-DOPA dioxygenase extradiol